MASGIYCIENILDRKKYIGFATNLSNRLKVHRHKLNENIHFNKYLQNAWNKYGEKSFKFWIVEEYPKNEELLKLMEIYFISYYNSFVRDGGGYNMTRGGDGTFGAHPSEKAIEIFRKNMIENSPMRGKFGKDSPLYGNHHSYITKKKQSDAQMGEKHWGFGEKRDGASSQYFGVYKKIRGKKRNVRWRVFIGQKGRVVAVGVYKTELDAANAFDKYIIEHNLPNPLNFPEDYPNRRIE